MLRTRPSRLTLSTLLATLALSGVFTPARLLAQGAHDFWISAWGTALVGRPQMPAAQVVPPQSSPASVAQPAMSPLPAPPSSPHFSNQTLRQVAHVSMGGSSVRVVLSNAFGTSPLAIGAAAIAIRDTGATLKTGTVRTLTFSARPATTIPPGAIVYSDPVDLLVPSLGDVVVDVYLPGTTDAPSPLTMHGGALQTNYVSGPGNFAGSAAFKPAATTRSWFLLARIEVAGGPGSATIVTIGDSITDGTASTPDTNRRWPDRLAERLTVWNSRLGVVNMGIAGNRVLGDASYAFGVNAQARFDRDVLAHPNVAYVVVMEGINDIGMARAGATPSAEDLAAAHAQLVQRAHARGIRIYGATLTPFEGAAYYTPEGEAKRQALNAWVRTSGTYDAVLDFDAVTRDPMQPGRLLPLYDSGDRLHPSDAGYEAMGNAIRLELFGPPSDRR